MKPAELKELILSKNYLFEVSSNTGSKTYGKQTYAQVKDMHESFENYLNKIAKAQNTKQLGVQLYQKNGSSALKKGFFLVDIEAVVDSTHNVEVSTKPVSTPTTVIQNTVDKNPSNKMEDIKTIVENTRLSTELKYLQTENDRLRESNKKLDQQNDTLHAEVLKLMRELNTKEASLDLDFKKKELELMSEQKRGLSGFMDDVKSLPPEAWTFLGSIFSKNGNKQIASAEGSENDLSGLKKHPNPDAQGAIEQAYELMVEQRPEVVGMLVSLTDYFCKHTDHLILAFKKFFPGAVTENTGTNGTEEEETEE